MDSNIERELSEYRRQRRINTVAQYFKNFYIRKFSKVTNKVITKNDIKPLPTKERFELICKQLPLQLDESHLNDDHDEITFTFMQYLYFTLWFFLWGTLYGVFVRFEFGTVFVIFSALGAMYYNTRTEPKPENEISAYSVFNKNCHCIDGTLDADKLTREMIYGM